MSGAFRVNATRASSGDVVLNTTPPTTVGACGVTQRGPFADTLCTGYAEYQAAFGGPTVNSQNMDLAVKAFFDEGGQIMHVARVVHYTDPTNPATKTSAAGSLMLTTPTQAPTSGSKASATGPFALANGDTLTFKIDGGGVQTATFSGTAASRTSGNGTYALADGNVLSVSIDGGTVQNIPFHTRDVREHRGSDPPPRSSRRSTPTSPAIRSAHRPPSAAPR